MNVYVRKFSYKEKEWIRKIKLDPRKIRDIPDYLKSDYSFLRAVVRQNIFTIDFIDDIVFNKLEFKNQVINVIVKEKY